MSWSRPTRSNPLLECPSYGHPGEITDRLRLRGVPAPVGHVKLARVLGHWHGPAVDRLRLAKQDGA